jgi:hypothetical protein
VTRLRGLTAGMMAALALAAVLALAALSEHDPSGRGAEFQRLVGGLGMGPATDLSGCEQAFDPRLCTHCAWEDGPIPGGRAFCPDHALSVVDYPEPTDAPVR